MLGLRFSFSEDSGTVGLVMLCIVRVSSELSSSGLREDLSLIRFKSSFSASLYAFSRRSLSRVIYCSF